MAVIKILRDIARNDRGATAVEYGLIVALIALVAVAGLTTMGTKVGDTFNNIGSKL